MIEFGLIGYPLKNTFSENYFAKKFIDMGLTGHSYKNFPLENIALFPDLLSQSKQFKGFNVTIPYKQSIIKFLHRLSPEAEGSGAVNCIKANFDEEQQHYFLSGFNTDIYGFSASIKPLLAHNDASLRALILGTGGAAKAAAYALKQWGIPALFVSRHMSNPAYCLRYHELNKEIIQNHHLIINCTPSGMFPDIESCPDIPYEWITDKHICYDMVYLPEETVFMKKSAAQGAAVKNGLDMLHLQAEKSWTIWTTNNF